MTMTKTLGEQTDRCIKQRQGLETTCNCTCVADNPALCCQAAGVVHSGAPTAYLADLALHATLSPVGHNVHVAAVIVQGWVFPGWSGIGMVTAGVLVQSFPQTSTVMRQSSRPA